ncbi:geranylgeranyl reductase family protein [Corynebacterium godavarianum]|uniref:Geranylgeranyl reductase family protein n=2 Tax=Corynebacterium godavarianum TaxID=2054421 RepID=A0ABY3DXT7_9CORY|nr:geranylgeranyl reductase family protein [Corynebacterium godavarianum]MBL7285070.1 geranylgeranyl reductase family protein [Corynebacterium godavarianum]TSJ70367.1 geranylgeranyl reductase family protein [Corynebacterium godavarianum]
MLSVMDVVDCVVVGAGPSGSIAAIAAQRAGLSTLLLDAQPHRRDKTCGDGLTPRAVHTLRTLGLESALPAYRNRGLKLHGYGGSVTAPWPTGRYGTQGSASPRSLFDATLADQAATSGATVWHGCAATGADFDAHDSITAVHTDRGPVRTRWVIVADGVRSPFGKSLGRIWHKDQVYGIAARSYCTTSLSTEPWMHSHVELRDDAGEIQPGYGWIFPLGDGTVNLGCGALSTQARPAKVNTKKLLAHYARQQRDAWDLGEPQHVTSALLPMGGAVSNVAGPNWALIGDAAACVNPLNGEGIDYGMETAVMAVELLGEGKDLTLAWPYALRRAYGDAFALARTAARLLTYPQFLPAAGPLALRGLGGRYLMPAAARLMGNLVTEEDTDLLARAWRAAGRLAPRGEALWDPR